MGSVGRHRGLAYRLLFPYNNLKTKCNTMKKKISCQSAIAAVAGLVASMVFCLIHAWETVGGVALVVAPLFLVSVVLVFLLETASASRVLKHAAFVSPLAFILIVTFYAMWADAQAIKNTGVCDGGGGLALYLLEAYLVGLAIAYVCLIALDRKAGG
jgi:hypothetical protein